MSNISQVGKNLKKKLSFNDYSTPAQQQDVTPADTHTVIPVHTHASAPVGQQEITTALPQVAHTRTNDIPAGKHIEHADKQVHKSTDKQVRQSTVKTKATFYLSEQDSQALTDMFIKRLQSKNKTDKSALVAEAIQLLYKREMK